MVTPTKETRSGFLSTPVGWVFCGFAAIGLFFIIAEHRAHLGFVVPYLPLVLMGVCLVLHSYMHGRGRGRKSDEDPNDRSGPDTSRRHHH